MPLTPKEAADLLVLLQRVTLQAGEARAFVELVDKLTMLSTQPPVEPAPQAD